MKKNIYKLICSYLCLTFVNLLISNNYLMINYLQNLNLFLYFVMFIIIFTLFHLIEKKYGIKYIYLLTIILSLLVSICFVSKIDNLLFIVFDIIFVLLLYLFIPKENKEYHIKNDKIFIICLGIIFVLIPILLGILRYASYTTPTYDFGIFAQSYHSMSKFKGAITTLERSYPLSHLKVHLSIILYLLLPIYMLFDNPIILQVMGPILIFSSVIPIYLICKKNKFNNLSRLLVCITFFIYPAITTGTYFDFHENFFILPLLMWLLYFNESKNNKLYYIFLILCLLVKEDISIYMTVFGLYLLFNKETRKKGIYTILISVIYFLSAYLFLSKVGIGVMSNRYSKLIYDNSGLFGIIKTIIVNPGYVINILSNDINKLKYIVYLLLPLGFIPFITKKYSRYILFIPIILNILGDSIYQYDISFHYSYVVIAFLFYLFIKNIKDIKFDLRISYALVLISSILLYYNLCITKVDYMINYYNYYKDTFNLVDKTLESIPKNVSILSDTFYTSHLYDYDEVYDIDYYDSYDNIDYIIIDERLSNAQEKKDKALENGFEIIIYEYGTISILRKVDI